MLVIIVNSCCGCDCRRGGFTPPPPPMHKRYHRHLMPCTICNRVKGPFAKIDMKNISFSLSTLKVWLICFNYLVAGSMEYNSYLRIREPGFVCGRSWKMLSRSCNKSEDSLFRPIPRIIHAASNAPRKPRAQPDPVGQNG